MVTAGYGFKLDKTETIISLIEMIWERQKSEVSSRMHQAKTSHGGYSYETSYNSSSNRTKQQNGRNSCRWTAVTAGLRQEGSKST